MFLKLFFIYIYIFIDLINKQWILNYYLYKHLSKNILFIKFICIYNKGITLNFFENKFKYYQWILIIFLIIIITKLLFDIINFINFKLSINNIILLGGILGNLLDRILYGGVIDFIILNIINYYFIIINFSDLFIYINIFYFLLKIKN